MLPYFGNHAMHSIYIYYSAHPQAFYVVRIPTLPHLVFVDKDYSSHALETITQHNVLRMRQLI